MSISALHPGDDLILPGVAIPFLHHPTKRGEIALDLKEILIGNLLPLHFKRRCQLGPKLSKLFLIIMCSFVLGDSIRDRSASSRRSKCTNPIQAASSTTDTLDLAHRAYTLDRQSRHYLPHHRVLLLKPFALFPPSISMAVRSCLRILQRTR